MNGNQETLLEQLQERLAILEQREAQRQKRRQRVSHVLGRLHSKRGLILGLSVAMLSLVTTVCLYAATLSAPTAFVAGQPITAAAVNGNFTTLYNNDTALTTQILNNLVPIGTIVASTLTQAQMDAQCGTGLWKLADGSIAPTTFSAATTMANLPDLRGQFLRGMNASRTPAPDPDTRSVGGPQGDALQGHAHTWYNAQLSYGDNHDGVGTAAACLNRPTAPQVGLGTQTMVSDGTNGAPRIASEPAPPTLRSTGTSRSSDRERSLPDVQ